MNIMSNLPTHTVAPLAPVGRSAVILTRSTEVGSRAALSLGAVLVDDRSTLTSLPLVPDWLLGWLVWLWLGDVALSVEWVASLSTVRGGVLLEVLWSTVAMLRAAAVEVSAITHTNAFAAIAHLSVVVAVRWSTSIDGRNGVSWWWGLGRSWLLGNSLGDGLDLVSGWSWSWIDVRALAGGAQTGVVGEAVLVAVDFGITTPAVGRTAPSWLTDTVVAGWTAVLGSDQDGADAEGCEENLGEGEHCGRCEKEV